MIEFYTEEFKKRASKQIKEVNDMIENKLPKIQKWQMQGCFVVGEDFDAMYIPLTDGLGNQIGTDVKINLDSNREKYLVTSGERIIRLRHEIDNSVFETYSTKLQNDTLLTSIKFTNENDFIFVEIDEFNGVEKVKVLTNLDAEIFENALINRGASNILECIKSTYYGNNGRQRTRY